MRTAHKILVRELEGKLRRSLASPNIMLNWILKKKGEGMELDSPSSGQLRVLVNTAMNLRIPYQVENFLSAELLISAL
jgi:hypothetical protein